jgi:hypothetical protein
MKYLFRSLIREAASTSASCSLFLITQNMCSMLILILEPLLFRVFSSSDSRFPSLPEDC